MEGLDATSESKYKYGAPSLLRDIYKNEGFKGTMRGMIPTICREVPSFSAYFGTYFALADLGTWWFDFEEPDHMNKIFTKDFAWSLFAGGMAGCCCWAVSYPFDVVKTKMQVDGVTRTKYAGLGGKNERTNLNIALEIDAKTGYTVFFDNLPSP